MSARNCEHDTMFGEQQSSAFCSCPAQTFPVGTPADLVDATRHLGATSEYLVYSSELYASVLGLCSVTVRRTPRRASAPATSAQSALPHQLGMRDINSL